MRLSSLAAILALLVSMLAGSNAFAEAKKPNIIFILADDLGYTDVACYGSKYYETPNLDRLAASGMKFSSGYTCGPNCQPTRAALMSGQYGGRTGTYTVGGINRFNWESRTLRPADNVQALAPNAISLAQAMKNSGYATGMFGKWHLGKGENHPSKRGFDEAIETSGKHFGFDTDPPAEHPKDQYLADFLTDKAVDFIQRKKDGPFFLYLPHFGVHGPLQAKPELIAKFKAKAPVGGHKNPTYAAMIYSVDESVGRIVAELEKLKIADNTLIIFSSDNGGVGGYVRAGLSQAKDTTDNTPLRGGKGMLYEGGVRVPFIANWPGKIAPGASTDQAVCTVDLYPTFLELAGGDASKANQPLDGVSFVSILTGAASTLPRDAIYWHFPGYLGVGQDQWRTTPAGAIRVGDYKLLEFFEDGRLELYNLKEDLSQKNNLAVSDPERTKAMHEKLVAWRKSVNATMPTPHTPDPAAKNKKKRKGGGEDE